MLAYQDLHGELVDGELTAPNGKITENEDYAKLVNSGKRRGFNTKLGASWKGLSWNALISTSWGGLTTITRWRNSTSGGQMLWNPESYWSDMFDEVTNPNGKYPNTGHNDAGLTNASDFWQVSSFCCYIKNMSVGYTIPKQWVRAANIESVQLNLTGHNLWDFYNPYPKKYRNMYDNSQVLYPTLRTWSLGVNLTF